MGGPAVSRCKKNLLYLQELKQSKLLLFSSSAGNTHIEQLYTHLCFELTNVIRCTDLQLQNVRMLKMDYSTLW